jgi:hypothetical protein
MIVSVLSIRALVSTATMRTMTASCSTRRLPHNIGAESKGTQGRGKLIDSKYADNYSKAVTSADISGTESRILETRASVMTESVLTTTPNHMTTRLGENVFKNYGLP